MKPLVSVVMPTHNRGILIKRAIESIINQNYTNWELIIVDDGSTDNTEAIVAECTKLSNSNFKYIRLPENRGASYARNIGIENSRGDYITFLDSDDTYHEDKIKQQLNIFENSCLSRVGVVTCGRNDYKDDKLSSSWSPSNRGAVLPLLFMDVKIGAGTPFLMIDRKVIEDGVRFDVNINVVEDFDFVVQVLEKGYNLDFVTDKLVNVYHYSIDRNFNYDRGFEAREYLYKKYSDFFMKEIKIRNWFLYKTALFYSLSDKVYDQSNALRDFKETFPLYYKLITFNKSLKISTTKKISTKGLSLLFKTLAV